MMKILFITNVPAPYRVDFFNQLGKHCELTVVFDKLISDERDPSWCNQNFKNFKGIVLRGISINTDTAICPGIVRILRHNMYNCIINSNSYSPTGMMAILYCKTHNIPFFNEADGGFARSGKGLKEKLKKFLISAAIGNFSTSKALDEYFMFYGAKQDSIYRYPFTSLWKRDILPDSTTIEQREVLRTKYRNINNITHRPVIVAVGQFIHRKGFDVLIKSMSSLSRKYYLYIIGGNGSEYLELVREYDLDNIEFVEFLNKDKLREYYLAADLFVLPTREDIWGLVINEAMACGLPIITTTNCIAGLELVVDDENGYLVEVEDDEALAERIQRILSNNDLKDSMSINSLKRIKDYTIEEMAKKHIEVLSEFF